MAETIFISYSRSDGLYFANKLYDYLKGLDYKPWLDKRDIKPGDLWQEQSDLAIRKCWLLLFLATPESVKSRTCTAEWNRALTYKKPVVPLLFKETLLPLLLEQRQYISFMDSREKGFDELLDYLNFLKSPEGELRILQSRYDDMELELNHHPHPKVVKAEMRQLKTLIEFKKKALEQPEVQILKYRETVELGVIRERDRFAKERESDRSVPRRRVIGTPPLGVNKIFRDRQPEKTQIQNALISFRDIRLVSIYGKAGSGKTALACKVMQELEKQREHIFGLTYHSTQNDNLNFEQIYFACSRILGGNTEKNLNQVWKSSITNTGLKIQTLLTSLRDHCIVILLDNMEMLQNADGDVTDGDLKLFINAFLTGSQKARLLLTSREALKISPENQRFEKVIPLDQGLPINHATDLLIELGKNRNLELSQPSKSSLKSAAKRAFGYPRALETIVGILDEDHNLSLEELLKKSKIFNEKVLENLVKEAHSRLSADSKQVIQALAVFERPVTSTALMYLLEPYAATLDINGELHRLIRGYFVKVNLSTDEYVIHPLDREYSYNLIPRDISNSYNIKALERRAATYYDLLKTSPDGWSTIADVEPQLHAFQHLCRAEDFDEAARLIDSIDTNYLNRWGYIALVIKLRLQLVGKLQDEHLQCKNFASLGEAYRRLGLGEKSIDFSRSALDLAVKINDQSLENICLGYLGRTFRTMGRVQEAVEYLERAIHLAQALGDRASEGRNIGNLGSCYYNLGDFDRSISLLEQSIEINQTIGEKAEAAERIGHLGNPYFHLGNYEKAIELYSKALSMSRENRSRRGEGYWLYQLGRAYISSGSTTQGIGFLQQAAEIANEIDESRLKCFIYGVLSETYLHLGQLPQALSMAEKAAKDDVPELNANVAALYGIILARLGKTDVASEILHRAIRFANSLLNKTERFFEAKYSRAISYATLSVLEQNQEKAFFLKEAEREYLDAISCCNAKGVITRNVQLLLELKVLDSYHSVDILLELFPGYNP